MAGHSKWAQIKRKKEASDIKKSKIFSKLARLITNQAKINKGDKNSPGLRSAIEKAKSFNMPLENIERAIKRAIEEKNILKEVSYEAYGPGGVGIIIEALTDNSNRTVQDIKHILSSFGANLTTPGAVSWNFQKVGESGNVKWSPINKISISKENLEILNKLIESLEELDDVQGVFTNLEE